ncbi:hypothetical protein M431DRAFT_448569 [Trichoderma harzianum CBS 226.95]|uniref:Uncharacterized protein n=1 Tax=Trichoderma harzianum CBS 226.95 TaxID=983964 RepID=A0A2T4AAI2_TRIHA|nr:hypothetical protein M431DRAFT_448569 [Trichoderma harzianum CBS 226.95]PTB54003.1 hypothetical protein M431DRAFT_448569 [Trichoderma harzianum CBS 226.95]
MLILVLGRSIIVTILFIFVIFANAPKTLVSIHWKNQPCASRFKSLNTRKKKKPPKYHRMSKYTRSPPLVCLFLTKPDLSPHHACVCVLPLLRKLTQPASHINSF